MTRRARKLNKTGRNAYDRYVSLPHYMIKSPAWRMLSSDAKAVLIEIKARFNGSNNGQIAYAVREAEDIWLSKDKASRALAQLVERGFLKVSRHSSFTVKTREARTWTLTSEPLAEGLATKDFMRWTAEPKSKTQSHGCDAQSHQCDRDKEKETKLPVTVSPVRPSTAKTAVSQSHQRDTSIYHLPNNSFPPTPPHQVGTKSNLAPASSLSVADPTRPQSAAAGRPAANDNPYQTLCKRIAAMVRLTEGEIGCFVMENDDLYEREAAGTLTEAELYQALHAAQLA